MFGRYLLVQRLARGGMGEIFLAKHGLAGFEKLAVIKKVLPHLSADDQFIARFIDEAQVAIHLSHVNVAQVFEVGRIGDEYFLALEYIDGRDLRRTLARLAHHKARMPVDLALFIVRELANGLAYAHRRTTPDGASLGLVHCDISPPNVLVSFEGETKLIDFGIAKSAMRGSTTDPKVGFGKFGYMAPEQLLRGGVVDHRTDLYAAGVVLFELLTGTRLYEAGAEPDYRALARKVARGDHALPSEIDRSLAPYDELVATALSPRPEERYQSAAELRDAIQHSLVAVNPTISTDRLGAYMRELFADEMAAQRALHDRVASAHLADFEEQFHTQSIPTVSFAIAQLPLPAPDPTVPVAPAPRAPRSPAQDTTAPPTDLLAPVSEHELGDAASTRAMAARRAGARRRVPVVAVGPALGALVVIGVVARWALAPEDPSPAPPAPRAPAVVDQRSISVEPIPVAPPAGAERAGAAPVSQAADPGSGGEPRTKGRDRPGPRPAHEAAPRAAVRKQAVPAARPPKPELTRAQLGQKFQQVRREYDDYKARFGSRLEKEWGDLATYIQYMPASDDGGRTEAARRLEEFRSRMRE